MANYGLSTTVKRYGTGSFYSPYASSRTKALLIQPTSGNFRIASGEDFILNLWVQYGSTYVGTASATYPLITFGNGGSTDGWAIGYLVGPNLGFGPVPYFRYNGTFIKTEFNGTNGANCNISSNGWNNFVIKRANGVITMTFTNTSAVPVITTANYSGSIGGTATGGAYLGPTNPFVTNGTNGAYVDELFFARGVSSVQRRNPTLGSINDGTLDSTVFLYQFDGNYFDDETGIQLFSAALTDNTSSMSATLSQVTSLKTAQAQITATTALTGDITSITGTQRFSSTPNSRFSLAATLTQTYRISPTITNTTGGYYLDNISLDSTTKKFGTQSLKIGGITTDAIKPEVLTAGGTNEWLALGNDNNGGTIYAWYSSNNGATWTRSVATGLPGATIFYANNINLQYHNGRFIFGYLAKIYTSTDSGANWTTFTPSISGEVAVTDKIYYANSLYIIISGWYGTGASYVYTSTDLTSWTRRTSILNTTFTQDSLQVQGIAASGTTVKIIVSCQQPSPGTTRYDLYTSTNSTTWTRELNFTGSSQGYLGTIATDGANNWMAQFVAYTNNVGSNEVYTKAGAGAWTRKNSGLEYLGRIFYFNSKWYAYNSGDQNFYSSTNLGTSWTLAFRVFAFYQKSSTTLAILDTGSSSSVDYKFVSTQDASTWTNSSIANLINIPETVTYTAEDNRYTTWKTLDFWIYFDPNGQGGRAQWIMSQATGYNPNNEDNWFLYAQVSGSTLVPPTESSTFFISDDNGSFASGLSLNAWHHVRVVKDGVNLAYFVDGTRRTTRTLTQDWHTNPGPLVIGGSQKANVNIYLDEVLLSKDILTPTTSTTYTTPTTAWTSTSSANLLLHFDNSLLDDNNLPLAGYLGSFFTMSTQAGKNIISGAGLSSTSSIQVSARKVKEIILDRQAVATMTVTAVIVSGSQVALAAAFDIELDGVRFKSAVATLTQAVTVTTAADKLVRASIAAGSIVSQIVVTARKLGGLADITAVTSISATAGVIRSASSALAQASTLAVANTRLRDSSAGLVSNTNTSATVQRVKITSVTLTSSYTVTAAVNKTARGSSNFSSIATVLSATVTKLNGIADITAVTRLTASGSITKQSSVGLVCALNLATNSGKLVTTAVTLTANSNSSVTVTKVKLVSASLTSSSTQSTSARVNKTIATGLASRFTLVARPIDIARSAMVVRSSLTINTRVARSTAQAALTTQVLWSYIYNKEVPLNQANDLWVVPADSRLHIIPASTANWTIEADQRAYIIEPDIREYQIAPGNTEFTIEG